MRKTAAVVFLAAIAVLAAVPLRAEATDKAVSATGIVRSVQASSRTVIVTLAEGGRDTTFNWNDDTKITGVLSPGAKVTIRYVPASSGGNLALQITVPRS